MSADFLSLSLCLSVVVCSKRLMPFILCLTVLAKTGKTKGFQDVAAVFGPSRGNRNTPGCHLDALTEVGQKRPVRGSDLD